AATATANRRFGRPNADAQMLPSAARGVGFSDWVHDTSFLAAASGCDAGCRPKMILGPKEQGYIKQSGQHAERRADRIEMAPRQQRGASLGGTEIAAGRRELVVRGHDAYQCEGHHRPDKHGSNKPPRASAHEPRRSAAEKAQQR